MFYKDNWLSWTYDGVKFGKKLFPKSKFEFQFNKSVNRPLKSHKEELLENTRVIRDSFTEPFDLLFSGGVDSEIILRCHVELKIPINVFIFKYENNYNYHDVRHALRICEELNVTPTVIDFNLQKFFETDAYDIWRTGYFLKAGMLPHMKMIESLDNIPIFGLGQPDWSFEDHKWQFNLNESDHSQSIYGVAINRPMLACWYEYSPEVILSHMQLPNMQRLIDNAVPGDQFSFDVSKYYLYKKIWPEIQIRVKRNGFEQFGTQPKVTSLELQSLLQFQKQHIDNLDISNTVCYFDQNQLINLLRK
jgi:hypothetical protein